MGRNGKASVESAELQKDFIEIDNKSTGLKISRIDRTGGDIELVLAGIRFQLRRGVAEELLGKLSNNMRPYAGYSIFDRIMEELDSIIDRLMSEDGAADDGRDPGRAEAYTKCLAMIRNPYQPDYEAERDRHMERFYQRNGEAG